MSPIGAAFSPLAYLSLYRRTTVYGGEVVIREFPFTARSDVESAGSAGTASGEIAAGTLPKRTRELPFLSFMDEDVEPGTEYEYWATVTNALGLESAPSPKQTVMPMAFDRRGIVLLHTIGQSYGCVHLDSTRAFYWSWARTYSFETLAFDPGQNPEIAYADFSMQELARYRTAVVVMEYADPAYPHYPLYAWLRDYLSHGGACIFVLRNYGGVDFGGIMSGTLGIHGAIRQPLTYFDFSFPPTYFHLVAEFHSAHAVTRGYPDLDGDSSRAVANPLLGFLLPKYGPFIGGGIVARVGAYDSIASGAEVLYTYVAGYPDTSSLHGLPVAIKRESAAGRAIAFNFPLSVMERESAWRALTMAVADLGGDTTPVATPSPPPARTAGIIPWLFGSGTEPPNPDWDINRDGTIDIRDVVLSVNRTWR